MEITRETPTRTFDAIVVGTGATGGWAAKQLTEAGMDVLVLDAGPMPEPSRDFAHHEMPWERPNRGLSFDRRRSQPASSDKLPLVWSRNADNPTLPSRQALYLGALAHRGRRTLHWSRAAHRLSDFDFKAASRDGYGDDWPISYAEIALLLRQGRGTHRGQRLRGGLSAVARRQVPARHELQLRGAAVPRKTALRMGLPATHRRIAQLSRPHKGRPACHFCGACREGCDIGAMFNSIVSTLPPADATKRMTCARTQSCAVLMGKDGKARGVSYIDRLTKQEYEAKAKNVIVAASTLESVRILWNSHKDGLGNSSGMLGHYIMDQVAGASVSGVFPQLRNSPPRNDDGKSSGAFIANFRNIESRHPKFIRGYCMSMSGGQSERPLYALDKKGYGAALKQSIRTIRPWQGSTCQPGTCCRAMRISQASTPRSRTPGASPC
ncbi:MAG: GMC family oxidoreductase N-terminal domain-containing protein [Bryobacterales bacterium]